MFKVQLLIDHWTNKQNNLGNYIRRPVNQELSRILYELSNKYHEDVLMMEAFTSGLYTQ